MVKNQKIGVVTVTYNSEEVLPEFLASLFAQTHCDWILYAVDNASRDRSIELLRQQGDPRVQVIPNSENVGVAEGNNIGIRAALSDGCGTVLLLNNDVVFPPEMLEHLFSGMKSFGCDMITPKMMYHNEPDRIWCAGGRFNRAKGYKTVHIGDGELDRGQYNQSRRITYVPTCCVLIDSGVFATLGLMDARYFVYFDDTDFMYRALKQGLSLQYYPGTTLLHKVSRLTGGKSSSFTIRFFTRNRVYFLLKHFGIPISLPHLALLQVSFFARILLRREGIATFMVRQRAFREGWKIA